jgi:hypothetical protein
MNLSSEPSRYVPRPRTVGTQEQNPSQLRTSITSLRRELAQERRQGHLNVKALLEHIDTVTSNLADLRQLAIQQIAKELKPSERK